MEFFRDFDDDLTGYEEHLRDSQNLGDARRCPRHPHVKTSSDDGMFDGLCGECENEMADLQALQDELDSVAGEPGELVLPKAARKDAMTYLQGRGWRNVRAVGGKVVWS